MLTTTLLTVLLLIAPSSAAGSGAAGSDAATAETSQATAGDVAHGWPADLAAVAPGRSRNVPWLRSATAARLFLHGLPRDTERARTKLVEALAMIAARHGQTFEHERWQAWFDAQPWYRPHPSYSIARLSQGEREAADLLVRALDDRRPR